MSYLEHIEILAGKLIHGFPDSGFLDRLNKEMLQTLVRMYEQGFDDVKESTGISTEEHAERVQRARQAIDRLYGQPD